MYGFRFHSFFSTHKNNWDTCFLYSVELICINSAVSFFDQLMLYYIILILWFPGCCRKGDITSGFQSYLDGSSWDDTTASVDGETGKTEVATQQPSSKCSLSDIGLWCGPHSHGTHCLCTFWPDLVSVVAVVDKFPLNPMWFDTLCSPLLGC